MARRSCGAQLDSSTQKTKPLDFSAWIEVDLSALEHNFQLILEHSQAPLLPILKGDAYGHGAPVVAAFLKSKGQDVFGVSSLEEALPILQSTSVRILVLAPPLPEQLPLFIQHGLLVTLTSTAQVHDLVLACKKMGKEMSVHIKVDTGFGRLGVAPQDFLALVEETLLHPELRLVGVFTHFSSAQHDRHFTGKQLDILLALKEQLEHCHGHLQLTWHAANSAALLQLPASHLDLIRPGTLLYGQSPLPLDASWNLTESWQFKARIIQAKTLPRGYFVGYGRSYRTKKPTRVAVIPVGYGHGLELEPVSSPWRQLKQMAGTLIKVPHFVFHAGRPLPLLGRLGMGLSCVDVSARPDLDVGDEVTIRMRRVTANRHVPHIYYRAGRLVCLVWNNEVFDPTGRRTSLRAIFPKESLLRSRFQPAQHSHFGQ